VGEMWLSRRLFDPLSKGEDVALGKGLCCVW
jgi:hypothetical protein